MLTAAALEHRRLALAAEGKLLPATDDGRPRAVRLSVFWQAPQYLLVGCSEVLTSISQMEFFYDQSPESMRSCSMALQLLATALGGFTASGLMQLVSAVSARSGREWISPQDMNMGRLDLFFLLLAGLMARARPPRLVPSAPARLPLSLIKTRSPAPTLRRSTSSPSWRSRRASSTSGPRDSASTGPFPPPSWDASASAGCVRHQKHIL